MSNIADLFVVNHGAGVSVAPNRVSVGPDHCFLLESGPFGGPVLSFGHTSVIEFRFFNSILSVCSSPREAGRFPGPFPEHIQPECPVGGVGLEAFARQLLGTEVLERPVNEFVVPAVVIEANEGPDVEHVLVSGCHEGFARRCVRREVDQLLRLSRSAWKSQVSPRSAGENRFQRSAGRHPCERRWVRSGSVSE